MKLNNRTREQVLQHAEQAAQKDRISALRAQEYDLAEDIYLHMIGDAKKLVEALPKGFLMEKANFKVTCCAKDFNTITDRGVTCYAINLRHSRRFPHRYVHFGYELPTGSPLEKRALDLMAAHKALWKQVKVLRAELHAVLYGCSTRAKLIDTWPEAEKYLPEEQTKPQLPAVTGDRINLAMAQVAAS